MATQWYYKQQGNERGPVTAETLRSLAASGELVASDMVRSAGADSWQRADSVVDLSGSLDIVPPSGDSAMSCDRATSEMAAADASWCSLELQSTDTKASIKWSVSGAQTVVSKPDSARRTPIVKVPRRSLKIGHGATKTGRLEKLARQSTVASTNNAEADTIVSPEVPPVIESRRQ